MEYLFTLQSMCDEEFKRQESTSEVNQLHMDQLLHVKGTLILISSRSSVWLDLLWVSSRQIDNNSIDSSIPPTWGNISGLFKL